METMNSSFSTSSSTSSSSSIPIPSSSTLPSWFRRLTWDDNYDIIFSLAYYGTRYNGYQRQMGVQQRRSQPTTVEEVLHTVFERIMKERFPYYADMVHYPLFSSMTVNSASRLDAGVHCRDLILRASLPVYTVLPLPFVPVIRPSSSSSSVSSGSSSSSSSSTLPTTATAFLTPSTAPTTLDTPSRMIEELHRLLPSDIRITNLRYCRPSQIWLPKLCGGKVYSYYIATGHYPWSLPLNKHLIYVSDELDVSLMATALADFVGVHDYRYFSSLPRDYAKNNYLHLPPQLNKSKFDNNNNDNNNNNNNTYTKKRKGNNGAIVPNDNDDDDNDSDEEILDSSVPMEDTNSSPTMVDNDDNNAEKKNSFHSVDKQKNVKTSIREIRSVNITLLSPDECNFSLFRSDLSSSGKGIIVPPLSPTSDPTVVGNHTILPSKEKTMEIYHLAKPTKTDIQGSTLSASEPTTVSATMLSSSSSSSSFSSTVPPRCILRFDIDGKGFLKHQIRHIIGTVLEIGKHRLPYTFIKNTLQSIKEYNEFINQQSYMDKYLSKDPELLAVLSAYVARIPSMDLAAYQVPGRGLWLQKTSIPLDFWENDLYTNNVYRDYCQEWDIPYEHYHGVGFVCGRETVNQRREEKKIIRQKLITNLQLFQTDDDTKDRNEENTHDGEGKIL